MKGAAGGGAKTENSVAHTSGRQIVTAAEK
jgi:hypothetical protein